jgi:hypothetical protein
MPRAWRPRPWVRDTLAGSKAALVHYCGRVQPGRFFDFAAAVHSRSAGVIRLTRLSTKTITIVRTIYTSRKCLDGALPFLSRQFPWNIWNTTAHRGSLTPPTAAARPVYRWANQEIGRFGKMKWTREAGKLESEPLSV